MTKKISRIIGLIMFVVAVAFIVFAMGNPQASFPWSNTITYTLYSLYVMAMLVLIVAPIKKK